jgi:hypothetical protein
MASRVVGALEMHFHHLDFSVHHFETWGLLEGQPI